MRNAQVHSNPQETPKVASVDSEGGEFAAEWKQEAFMFLMSLNVVKRNKIYQGTVSHKTKMKRRSLNKRQKASRKANR